MDEKDVKACLECGNAFNHITRRKHHCKICGRVVCWFCSMHTLHDTHKPEAGKVRACNSCYAASHSPQLGPANGSATHSLPHSQSASLSVPHSPMDDPHSVSSSHDSVSSTYSLSSPSVVQQLAPLKDSLQPLPMPVFSSADPVDNTVAAVTSILLDEQARNEQMSNPPPHISAHTTLPPASPAHSHVISDAMPHSVAAESPHQHDPGHLHIIVPAKSPRGKHSESDPSTPAVFKPDVSPVSASEPVSPSHALEQALKHQPISSSPSHTPHTPQPHHTHHTPHFGHTPRHGSEHHASPKHEHGFFHHHSHSQSDMPTSVTTVTSCTTSSSTTTAAGATSTTTTTTATATVTPLSPPPVEEQVILDLPMKLCLTGDHRVLTRQGWKSIAEVEEKRDEALSFNVGSYAMEWKPIVKVTSRVIDPTDDADDLFRMQGSYMDVIATRNHRMLLACVSSYTANGLSKKKQLEYREVGDLLTLTYNNDMESTVTNFSHSYSRHIVCAGINKQAAIKIVIPGLERVCNWWWERDEQVGFLSFVGFWLGDGHLDTLDGHVMIGQRKVEANKWATALFDHVFPGCWYDNTGYSSGKPDPLKFVYKVLCPPLYEYLRAMSIGPLGYNPRDPAQLRAYPHFAKDEELATEEQKSGYCTPFNTLGYESRWTEDKMLATLIKSTAAEHETEEEGQEGEDEEEGTSEEQDDAEEEDQTVEEDAAPAPAAAREYYVPKGSHSEVWRSFRRIRGDDAHVHCPRCSKDYGWHGVGTGNLLRQLRSCDGAEPPLDEQVEADLARRRAKRSATADASAGKEEATEAGTEVEADDDVPPLEVRAVNAEGETAEIACAEAVAVDDEKEEEAVGRRLRAQGKVCWYYRQAVPAPAAAPLAPSSSWWIIINGNWFYLKRWLGGAQQMANVYSRLSRSQAIALLDGFCRADGRWLSIQYEDDEDNTQPHEPTGSWECSGSSFPLIDQLQMIGQLAGARVSLSLHTKAGTFTEYQGRRLTFSVDHWQLKFGFTNAKRPFNSAQFAQPLDVTHGSIDARGYYNYENDGKVYCISVESNTNFLTQRLSLKRTEGGGLGVKAHAHFIGNCLVILKKTAQEMKRRYSEYLRTKEARHEAQPLTFQQYMFFSTIRTLPDFLFKKTDLAYCMMRDDNQTVVGKELFCRYAPILPPLASKLDADKVFDALAVDYGDGVRGVGLNVFKAYVENLQREWDQSKHWEGWHDDYSVAKSEVMLSIRNGVTDTTHFPPHMGAVGLTTSHLLYQSVFKKRRCIHWLDIVKIERNSDGFLRKADNAGIKLHFLRESQHDHSKEGAETKEEAELEALHAEDTKHLTVHHTAAGRAAAKHRKHSHGDKDKAPVKVLLWDLPGMSSEAHHLKVCFYLQLRILHTSHLMHAQLHDSDPQTAAATLQETFDLVRRMRALEHIAGISVDASKLNPYGDFDDRGKDEFVRRIREVVRTTQRVRDSKQNWLTKILPGLAGEKDGVKGSKGEHGLDDIDPEFKPAYKTLAEMEKTAEEQEPFSVKNFSYNVKLFSQQLQAVIFFLSLVSKVRNWDNPLVTASIVAVLLNMCYRNYLVYLPAIVILVNIAILVTFYFHPHMVENYLAEQKKKEAEQELLEDSTTNSAPVIVSTISTSSSATPHAGAAPHVHANGDVSPTPCSAAAQPIASAVTVVKPKADAHKKKEEPSGLLAKLKEYRDVAVKTKDHLESVQHGLHDVNMKMLRVEGLYKWAKFDTTLKFFCLMVAVFFLLVLIPFRFLFPFILFDWVTDKWQKEGSAMDRILAEVPLPEKMPELD